MTTEILNGCAPAKPTKRPTTKLDIIADKNRRATLVIFVARELRKHGDPWVVEQAHKIERILTEKG